ncbi:hypothetical protein SAMN03159453_01366 [Pseudomonas sp. NFIX28]|nr:hypothetical protein SAMN03159453_01366 [Pseudomonas sp. NFIX28]
MYQNCARI